LVSTLYTDVIYVICKVKTLMVKVWFGQTCYRQTVSDHYTCTTISHTMMCPYRYAIQIMWS